MGGGTYITLTVILQAIGVIFAGVLMHLVSFLSCTSGKAAPWRSRGPSQSWH